MPVMRLLAQLLGTLMAAHLYVACTYAYGSLGHEIVGDIAWQNLCADAQTEVGPLLNGESLGRASRWPDWIRGEAEWAHTRPWHYINVGDEEPLKVVLAENGDHVIAAIEWSKVTLGNQQVGAEQRAQALRFFAHFVADVHQPLHVGRAADRGGNRIAVRVEGRKTNLHKLWDAQWLLRRDRKVRQYGLAGQVARIAEQAPNIDPALAPLDWARESQALRPIVYKLPPADADGVIAVDQAYLDAALTISQERLAAAGARLAAELNGLFCGALKTP